MKRWILAAAVASLVLVGGCSSGTERGTIKGRLLWDGGFRDVTSPHTGTITAVGPGGRRTTVRTGPRGRFTLTVPAGLTALTGSSPNYNDGRPDQCFARHKVTVRDDSRTSADVICFVR